MTWLRIDDRFASHPKIEALTDREFVVWMRLLCHVAKYAPNTGIVPRSRADSIQIVRGFTSKTKQKLIGLVLLEVHENGSDLVIHDWADYNGNLVDKRNKATERQRRHRDKNVTDESQENVTARDASRARAFPVPSPTPEDLEVQALATKAEPLTLPSRESLLSTLTQPVETDDRFDPVTALLKALPDADVGTETVLRAFRLPEYAYRQALEEVQAQHAGVRLAVAVLKRIEHERAGAAEAEPEHRPYDKPTDPAATITRLIDNGVITDHVTLEAELAALGVNGAQADELRALLP